MADLIERLRAKREEWKPNGGRAMVSPPTINLEAAAEIEALRTALSQEREAREKDVEQARIDLGEAMLVVEQQDRDVAALSASLAEAKRLQREEMLAVYDECESVAVPAHPAPYRQVELYRQAIRQLKARFLSQDPIR